MTDRLEFLRGRQKDPETGFPRIGGSDIGPILGIDPFRGPLDIYHDKTRPITAEDEAENVHILRGRLLEPIFADMFEVRSGRMIRELDEIVVHPDLPWATSNPDREIYDGANMPVLYPGPLELKAPTARTFDTLVGAGLFPSQIAQLQWEIFTGEYDWGCFAFGNLEGVDPPMIWFDDEPDHEWIERVLPKLEAFVHMVEARTPPEAAPLPDAPRPIFKGEIEALPKEVLAIEAWQSAVAVKNQAEQIEKDAKADVKVYMEAAGINALRVTGTGKAKLIQSKGSPKQDWNALEGHRPLDYDKTRLFLEDHGAGEDVAQWLTELELDLGRFVTPGTPYTYARFYAEKVK